MGFHLPNDRHVCPICKKDWFAEYDADEKIVCPYCKAEIPQVTITIITKRPKRR